MKPKRSYLGFLAILLFLFAVAGAAVILYKYSLEFGKAYTVGSLASILLILYAYCAKCPCRVKMCSHVIFGPLTRFLPKRRPGPYTFTDYSAVALAFLFMMFSPQIVLIRTMTWFVLFWLLMPASLFMIIFHTCPVCRNKQCGIRKLVVRNG